MALAIAIVGDGLNKFSTAVRTLGEGRARTAYSRAINHTGRVAGTAAGRALSDQTGLPKSTGRKAVRRKIERSTPATLAYTIHGKGGDISLRYFKPRETRRGVTAAPWNSRRLYPSSFMKAGFGNRWPKRVVKPNWNKQVFIRSGGKTKFGNDAFTKQTSGLFIPIEMVQGQTAAAWQQGAHRLQGRVAHEIRRITKGVVR